MQTSNILIRLSQPSKIICLRCRDVSIFSKVLICLKFIFYFSFTYKVIKSIFIIECIGIFFNIEKAVSVLNFINYYYIISSVRTGERKY